MEYCSEAATTLAMCEFNKPNVTFFATMGYAGQDCESWTYLRDLTAGEIDVQQVYERCNTQVRKVREVKGSPRAVVSDARVPADEVPDVVMRGDGDWTDQYVVERAYMDMLVCNSLNTAEMYGVYNLSSTYWGPYLQLL